MAGAENTAQNSVQIDTADANRQLDEIIMKAEQAKALLDSLPAGISVSGGSGGGLTDLLLSEAPAVSSLLGADSDTQAAIQSLRGFSGTSERLLSGSSLAFKEIAPRTASQILSNAQNYSALSNSALAAKALPRTSTSNTSAAKVLADAARDAALQRILQTRLSSRLATGPGLLRGLARGAGNLARRFGPKIGALGAVYLVGKYYYDFGKLTHSSMVQAADEGRGFFEVADKNVRRVRDNFGERALFGVGDTINLGLAKAFKFGSDLKNVAGGIINSIGADTDEEKVRIAKQAKKAMDESREAYYATIGKDSPEAIARREKESAWETARRASSEAAYKQAYDLAKRDAQVLQSMGWVDINNVERQLASQYLAVFLNAANNEAARARAKYGLPDADYLKTDGRRDIVGVKQKAANVAGARRGGR